MSSTETTIRETETAHGSVQYEVVECSSCGAEVSKNEAKRFVIGEFSHSYRGDWDARSVDATGWACNYCAEDPAGFPTPSRGLPSLGILNPFRLTVALIARPPGYFASLFRQEMDLDDFDEDFIRMILMMLWVFVLIIAAMGLATALVSLIA